MLRNILITSFLIGSACAVYLEYLKVDSNDLTDGSLISAASHGSLDEDEDLAVRMEKIPGACLLCKEVVKRVKKHLGNHDKVENMKEKLRRGCDKIRLGRARCRRLVNKHIDILVKELYTDDDPKTVCAKAGMCKMMGMLELMQVFPQNFQIL